MLQIIKYSKLWIFITILVTGASLVLVGTLGLKFGIDFTGGSLLEIIFKTNLPAVQEIKNTLVQENLGSLIIQPGEGNNFILRFQAVEEVQHQAVLKKLGEKFGELEEIRFNSIGPTIGKELREKALWSILLVLAGIIIYIGWAFRKVSKPVASWKYGALAVIALLHDLSLPLGVFAVLGYFQGVEIQSAFVAAMLTILGYSVNDTIVVFDRVRENLFKYRDTFENIVNRSVNETMARSINTTLTTILALVAIYFFGGESVKYFALALIIGIASGAYSSIFIASPLLVLWYNLRKYKY